MNIFQMNTDDLGLYVNYIVTFISFFWWYFIDDI